MQILNNCQRCSQLCQTCFRCQIKLRGFTLGKAKNTQIKYQIKRGNLQQNNNQRKTIKQIKKTRTQIKLNEVFDESQQHKQPNPNDTLLQLLKDLPLKHRPQDSFHKIQSGTIINLSQQNYEISPASQLQKNEKNILTPQITHLITPQIVLNNNIVRNNNEYPISISPQVTQIARNTISFPLRPAVDMNQFGFQDSYQARKTQAKRKAPQQSRQIQRQIATNPQINANKCLQCYKPVTNNQIMLCQAHYQLQLLVATQIYKNR